MGTWVADDSEPCVCVHRKSTVGCTKQNCLSIPSEPSVPWSSESRISGLSLPHTRTGKPGDLSHWLTIRQHCTVYDTRTRMGNRQELAFGPFHPSSSAHHLQGPSRCGLLSWETCLMCTVLEPHGPSAPSSSRGLNEEPYTIAPHPHSTVHTNTVL